jgi:hypothetical protein
MTSNPTVSEIVKESGARLKFSGRLDAEGVSAELESRFGGGG